MAMAVLTECRDTPDRPGARALQARQKLAAAFAATVGPIAASMRAEGCTLHHIALSLVASGIRTRRGAAWTAASVRALLQTVAQGEAAGARSHKPSSSEACASQPIAA